MNSSLYSKTIFILDHTHWLRENSGIQVEIEWGPGPTPKNRTYFTQFIPPVNKSLWTAGIETVLEYARVVTDLFANERLLRFGLTQGQLGICWMNDNWELEQQTMSWILEKLGTSGAPQQPPLPHAKSIPSAVSGLQAGIKSALEALGQPTPGQMRFMKGHGKSSLKAINKGRIIAITSLSSQSVGKSGMGVDFEEFLGNALNQHNNTAAASDNLLPILECEFVLISIHPLGKKFSTVQPREKHEVLPFLNFETHVVDAEEIVSLMMDLCVQHHDLVATVVTGIPMKEEQNAQHSSNYDVKLWHPKMYASGNENQILKWSSPLTPKTNGLQLNHCTAAVRIAPVDVNGRPTTCLTSFLMNGRSVWLESVSKKSSTGKSTSHLLTSHGGEMWLHVIETARNVLEDPPSISEGVGGRVTDYRIPDFADLIHMNILIPFPKNYYEHTLINKNKAIERESGNPFVRRRSSSLSEDSKKPIELAKERVLRKTAFWPMTIGGSLLFQMTVHIESLLKLMPKDSMTDAEKGDCVQCIWNLMTVEARNEAPIPSGHHKKGQKRDEQWRTVYNELEVFIKANQHSDNHKKVLECFIESKRAESKVDNRMSEREDKEKSQKKLNDMEKALASLASFGTSTTSVSTDSPASPTPTPCKIEDSPASPNPKSSTVLSLWSAKHERKNLRVLTNTQLYAHLNKKDKGQQHGTDSGGSGDGNENGRKPLDSKS